MLVILYIPGIPCLSPVSTTRRLLVIISYSLQPPAMKLRPDLLEAKYWIYPLNQPKRDYQFNIVQHALYDNTVVALPTGMGKTFVAGVIMLNCTSPSFIETLSADVLAVYRWFPEGKVVFVAPTKPLVAQQIEACHRTCGIPGSDAAELTGEIPKAMRNRLVCNMHRCQTALS